MSDSLTQFERIETPGQISFHSLVDTRRAIFITKSGIHLRGNWANAEGAEVAETPALLRAALEAHDALQPPPAPPKATGRAPKGEPLPEPPKVDSP